MVCVTQQKNCERLIQKGSALRKYIQAAELYVFHVVTGEDKFLNSDKESNALEYLFSITKAENGNMVVTRSEDISKSIIDFVKKNEIFDIIIGESPSDEDEDEDTFLNRLKKKLPDVKFHIVSKETV